MSIFFATYKTEDKEEKLLSQVNSINTLKSDRDTYLADDSLFSSLPGGTISYWIDEDSLKCYSNFNQLEEGNLSVKHGTSTSDDFRFLRLWWEVQVGSEYISFSKGGEYSKYYSDLHLCIDARDNLAKLKSFDRSIVRNPNFHREQGLTWSRRTSRGLSVRPLNKGGVFADKGPGIFAKNFDHKYLLASLAILNSSVFEHLLTVQLAAVDAAARSYEIGILQKTPFPTLSEADIDYLSKLALEAWRCKYISDGFNEISHAFIGPYALFEKQLKVTPAVLDENFKTIQVEINKKCTELFGISNPKLVESLMNKDLDEINTSFSDDNIKRNDLASWIIGVAFGRFREHESHKLVLEDVHPTQPFAELATYSPAIRDEQVDSQGPIFEVCSDKNELANASAKIILDLGLDFEFDFKRWLRIDFFQFHHDKYAKSRRNSPIYWPLQTPSGSYTLWVYYHHLNEQTLYTCVNNFVEPKLEQVEQDLNGLRSKSARSSQEEKELEKLSDLASELRDFRDELLRLAKFWKPTLNDGVQITAAPLWKLFQHKAWQKKLKQTWESLEKGDYDWAHLACSIWPERVLRKCHQDRSLAIAHDVEDHFWQEVEVPVKRGKKLTGETKLEWQPKDFSEAELTALVKKLAEELK